MKYRRIVVCLLVLTGVGFGSAWAQIAVTDPATTGRNAVIAMLRNQILEAVRIQGERLRSMAQRLSVSTNLGKYATPDRPDAPAYNETNTLAYGDSYRRALAHGDASGSAYNYVSRTRQLPGDLLAGLSPGARDMVGQALATLDAADSTIIAGTHQAGLLRWNGQRELAAIDALEADVINPAEDQSTTAVLDKISGAALLEARQKQARLQYLSAIVEQLVVDNKRARDTEAALLNMQMRRLLVGDWGEDGGGMLSGASNDLRTWRQP
ncbi:MAG: hypothetical protein HY655_07065 [Acidobacteria bacterium]|nr:hypothetical protein [Acidobacteriota bacterium]